MSVSSGQRAVVFVSVGAALAALVAGHAAAGGRGNRTTMIGIKRPAATEAAFGGEGYGALAAPATSAYVTHERSIEVGADGVVKFPGVAALLDAATVEFRSATDPTGTRVVEQRLVNDVIDPEALLFRQLGKPVVVTLASGELRGTLRALSPDALVIDSDDHAAHIVPRGPQLLGVALPAASVNQEPTLEWRLTTARPGRHDVVVARTDGLAWQPDYSAVLADGGAVNLSAWATITNDTGSDFVDANLTLTAGGGDGVFATLGLAPGRPSHTKPQEWKIQGKIALRAGQTVQVELAPKKVGVKARPTQVFEALAEGAGADNAQPTSDCDAYEPLNPRTGQYLELEAGAPLPSGRVRILPTGRQRADGGRHRRAARQRHQRRRRAHRGGQRRRDRVRRAQPHPVPARPVGSRAARGRRADGHQRRRGGRRRRRPRDDVPLAQLEAHARERQGHARRRPDPGVAGAPGQGREQDHHLHRAIQLVIAVRRVLVTGRRSSPRPAVWADAGRPPTAPPSTRASRCTATAR